MILRYTLRQDEPIASTARANRCDAGHYTANCEPAKDEYTLSFWEPIENTTRAESPPILRTCQRLRQEGLPIFYEENTLEILWTPGSVGLSCELTHYCCDILGGSKTYVTDLEGFRTDKDELNMSSLSTTPDSPDDENLQRHHEIPYLNIQAQRLQRLAPIISKCKKFHVKVELLDYSDESCLIMCRALRGILDGCDVTVECHELASWNGIQEFVVREDWLRYFRILRCKSLEFLGRADPFFGCEVESMDDLIRLVTSNEPVQDTFRMWKNLWTSASAPVHTESCYPEFRAEMLSIFVHNACEYDLQVYEEWRERAFRTLEDQGFDRERLQQMARENAQAIQSE